MSITLSSKEAFWATSIIPSLKKSTLGHISCTIIVWIILGCFSDTIIEVSAPSSKRVSTLGHVNYAIIEGSTLDCVGHVAIEGSVMLVNVGHVIVE